MIGGKIAPLFENENGIIKPAIDVHYIDSFNKAIYLDFGEFQRPIPLI